MIFLSSLPYSLGKILGLSDVGKQQPSEVVKSVTLPPSHIKVFWLDCFLLTENYFF